MTSQITNKSIKGENHWRWHNDRNVLKTIQSIHNLSKPYKRDFRLKNNNEDYKNYHVDHIFPVKAFIECGIYDLSVINADDNLQIISVKENLQKSDKYDKIDFVKYLNKKNILHNLAP